MRRSERGFTLTEVMFMAVVSVIVTAAAVSSWLFTYQNWTKESVKTCLRMDLIKALGVMKSDLRLSSLTCMSFYPDIGQKCSAVLLPAAVCDANGFYTLTDDGNIRWDKTIVYHLYEEASGAKTLRRTVYNSWDVSLTDEQKFALLESVVSAGSGGIGSTTDTEFSRNVESFEMSAITSVIDFYDESSTAVKSEKVMLGYAYLASGDHTVKFEIAGKNDDSVGYDIGVDSIAIEPCGSRRDAEYYSSTYAPPDSITVVGGSAQKVYGSIWSSGGYLELSGGVGDSMEFSDYYDLWRDSAFESVALNNTEKSGDDVSIRMVNVLDVPEEEKDEPMNIIWSASEATGGSSEGESTWIPMVEDMTIRVVLDDGDIGGFTGEAGGKYFVRVKFAAVEGAPYGSVIIRRAYITKKDESSAESYDGLPNQSPGALEVGEYHRHQQLFFEDESGNAVESVLLEPGEEVWSLWTAYPIRNDSDYFVSCYLSGVDGQPVCVRFWDETGVDNMHIVFHDDGSYDYTKLAGMPNWTQEMAEPSFTATVVPAGSIYTVKELDFADPGKGWVESAALDTGVSSPAYGDIKCTNQNSGITLKGRSGSSETMSDAMDWSLISDGSIDGTGRYLQYRAELSANPIWACPTLELAYEDYVEQQIILPAYAFPQDGGYYLATSLTDITWLDDVEIDWPGDERLCAVTGYIAKKNDYGQAAVSIDGVEPISVLGVKIRLRDAARGTVVENSIDVNPLNTNK